MPPHEDHAVCLRVWDWSETSQTAALFTRNLGLVRGLAKGSKRPKSDFSGGLEPLSLGQVGLHIKPATELALITHWDLVEVFPALRNALHAYNAGLYMAELVLAFAGDHDPHPGLFDALLAALRALGDAHQTRRAVLTLQWAALVEAGYLPVLDRLSTAPGPLPESAAFLFDPGQGGLVAPAEPGPPALGADGVDWRVRASTVRLLNALHADPASAALTEPEPVDRAARFLAAYTRHILGHEPATHRALFPDLGRLPGSGNPPTGQSA